MTEQPHTEDSSDFDVTAANARSTTASLTVYHDGGCPVCRAEVSLMKQLDPTGDIAWVDITAADKPLLVADITYMDAMQRIHVRSSTGELLTGVDGFMAVWAKLPVYRHIVPLVRNVPGIRPLLILLYAGFARIRLWVYRERVAAQG